VHTVRIGELPQRSAGIVGLLLRARLGFAGHHVTDTLADTLQAAWMFVSGVYPLATLSALTYFLGP